MNDAGCAKSFHRSQHSCSGKTGASRALAALADARYVEFSGAAHAPFLSHPQRFASLVEGFVRG